MDSSNLTEMEVELINSGEDAVTVLERFNSPKGTESSLEKHRATIDKCFDGKSCVEDIVVALQKLEGAEKEVRFIPRKHAVCSPEGDKFATLSKNTGRLPS